MEFLCDSSRDNHEYISLARIMYMDPWGMGTRFKKQSEWGANKLFYYKCSDCE